MLRLQLSNLQCEEVRCFLDLYTSVSRNEDTDFVILDHSFRGIRQRIQNQRDILLSEGVELRLLLDHVKDQIATCEGRSFPKSSIEGLSEEDAGEA